MAADDTDATDAQAPWDEASFYEGILQVETEEEAKDLLDSFCELSIKDHPNHKTFEEWRALHKANIGYLAGNFGPDDGRKILELFDTVHPLLGPNPWDLTPEEVFEIGKTFATDLIEKGEDE